MTNIIKSASAQSPIVTIVNGKPTTLSTDVAEFFGKRHDNVARDIENIRKNLPLDRFLNFEETFVERPNPNNPNVMLKSKAYRLTRDGFTFLAMGFTGKKAQAFKWAYIDRFNQMEAELSQKYIGHHGLTPAQQKQFRDAVGKKAAKRSSAFGIIYSAVYDRYQVASYKDIPASKLDDALRFIDIMRVDLPALETEKKAPDQLTEADWEALRRFVYSMRYLFRNELRAFYDVLKTADSPHAPRFFELLNDDGLRRIENLLAKKGFAVQD
ncbi:MAG: Rha family transcriptional regulator, partial [Exiguobacterium sp.]|nr:Rha family transcriptional regulator [Exiguobacterium sp.]